VFVEGGTEERYLTHWYRLYRHQILMTIDPFRGGPLQLVQRAAGAMQGSVADAKRNRGRAFDQAWCIFDRDEHPNFAEALALAEKHRIAVAMSNPCVELWFLLHFEDHTAHLERQHAQSRAKTALQCGKALTESALRVLSELDRYDAARTRAINLDSKHAGDGSPVGSNPTSGVWRLIDEILSH
jgi:hypothetical protein